MTGLLADLKHALRLYRRTPGSSLIAVAVLAIGMAFVSSFLSLYVDLVLRPHPGFERSGGLVTIGQSDGERFNGLPLSLIERAADEMTSLDAAVGVMLNRLQSEDQSEPTIIEMVSRGFFDGMRPELHSGRGFDPAEHDVEAERVVIISYRYWQDEYDGRADVLDTTLDLELQPMYVMSGPDGMPEAPEEGELAFRIVGIMSPEMTGVLSTEASIWMPFERALPQIVLGPSPSQLFSGLTMGAFGRLSAGASTSAVIGEFDARYSDGIDGFNLQPGFRFDAIGGLVTNINVKRDSTRQLQVFLAASVLLALVAAANVSLFLLARAPGRRRELGIRLAVGAPLKRLARQLASEAGLLVVGSAVLGLMASFWLSNFLRGLAFLRQAQWRDVTLLDWRVLTLVAAFLLILTLLVSLAPVLGLKKMGIAASSRQVAARATVAQRVAGTVQIAIAGTLGGAAIAFGWYLGSMTFGYPGYEIGNRFTAQYSVPFDFTNFARYMEMMESQQAELPRRREAIEAIPGVSAVAFGQPVPGTNGRSWTRVPDPNDPTKQVELTIGSLDSRYIDVLGLRLLYGRAPADSDIDVAIVNQALGRAFFGRENVVGERAPGANLQQQAEIIGVLEDLSFRHPSADVEPILFRTQNRSLSATAIIESELTAARLQQELERIAEAGEIEMTVRNVRPIAMLRSDILAPDRARSLLTIGTAVIVVMLAAFGFYGTQRYLVTAGRREYAIRASLGAGPKALGRLVFMRGLLMSLPGLVLGALFAFILVAWLRDDFVSREISPGPVTVAVIAGLTALLLVASLGPARQARRTQPAPLLREE